MLKIKIDNGYIGVDTSGDKTLVMAEMFMAVHAFYNTLNDKDKKWFMDSFIDCYEEIFSDNAITGADINRACDRQEKKDFAEIVDALKKLEKVIEELGK